MRTRTLTILISDVQGYTERQSRSSRREIEEQLLRHKGLLAPIYAAFGGRVVKTMGDSFLVAFESPTDAVHAAVQVQRALAAANAGLADPADAVQVRVAITTGEVSVDDDGDVFGEPVNLAARLEGIAEAGTIYLTEATFLSMNRNEIPALEVGHRVFKGIPEEVKVYRILDAYVANARLLSPDEIRAIARSAAPATAPEKAGGGGRGEGPRTRVLLGLAVILLLVVAGIAILVSRGAGDPAPTGGGDRVPADVPAAPLEKLLDHLERAPPRERARVLRMIRDRVESHERAGDWGKAEEMARVVSDRLPASEEARDQRLELLRRDLDDAARTGRIRARTTEDPPRWYEENVEGLRARWRDVPAYRWLRAVWFLRADPTRAETADLAEEALAANPAARSDAAFRSHLASARDACPPRSPLRARYESLLVRPAKPR